MEEEKTTVAVDRQLSLVTLMGLPASGKSTFADTVVSLFSESPTTTCIVLRYDDFVPLQIQCQFPNTTLAAKSLRKNFLQCVHYVASKILNSESVFPNSTTSLDSDLFSVESLTTTQDESIVIDKTDFIQRVENILQECQDKIKKCDKCFLIIDDNNYYRSMRNEIYGIAKILQCSFCVLYLKTSASQAIERNLHRSLEFQVSPQVIQEMKKKIEEPNPMENNCDLYCVQINDTRETEIQSAVKSLLECSLSNPVVYTPPVDRSEDRRICNESEVHQADLILRKWINRQTTLSSFDSSNMKSPSNRKLKAQQLNMIKSTILQNLKNGEFKLCAQVSQYVEFEKEIISLTKKVPPAFQLPQDNVTNINTVEGDLSSLKLSNLPD